MRRNREPVAPLILHCHIPKTAGTTISAGFRNSFDFLHMHHYHPDPFYILSKATLERLLEIYPNLRSISSHHLRSFPLSVGKRPTFQKCLSQAPRKQSPNGCKSLTSSRNRKEGSFFFHLAPDVWVRRFHEGEPGFSGCTPFASALAVTRLHSIWLFLQRQKFLSPAESFSLSLLVQVMLFSGSRLRAIWRSTSMSQPI